MKLSRDYVPYTIILQRDALCHIIYCILFSAWVPFYFRIAEKLNIYKTQIPCLYFDVVWGVFGVFFFLVLGQIPAKILSTGSTVSSLWAISRMLLQGLLPWVHCMIFFITFKHCLLFKYFELDEVTYFELKSTLLVKDPDQYRSLCVKPFCIPLGLFVKQFLVH